MKWFIYIVECSDKSLYCGITNNIARRIDQHNSGKGAKYIRGRRPVRLVYSEEAESMSKAMKRERQIKKMKRSQKLNLIENVHLPNS